MIILTYQAVINEVTLFHKEAKAYPRILGEWQVLAGFFHENGGLI